MIGPPAIAALATHPRWRSGRAAKSQTDPPKKPDCTCQGRKERNDWRTARSHDVKTKSANSTRLRFGAAGLVRRAASLQRRFLLDEISTDIENLRVTDRSRMAETQQRCGSVYEGRAVSMRPRRQEQKTKRDMKQETKLSSTELTRYAVQLMSHTVGKSTEALLLCLAGDNYRKPKRSAPHRQRSGSRQTHRQTRSSCRENDLR